ncbi:acyl-CoA-binding protein [Burkholderiaceae bacterium]|jgi:diazepam-binding inhibitor (GABA receptor modulator, acyl-CoA-binding protein)|nr:acyl-CoA-binding protein [Burkholderiaceae bacterium]MDC0112295.1 acyl-CoA-binding protein [Burkholderiaceae bacterium]MDC1458861.1 acyl-CoA-binding protein [Burkholderiaceae bacterium]MDG1108593.1 acyl-CoA-binding protein [Burkholderiaceae bacterium]MDG1382519.1 acyl-CoA-binding protein [Burkholderiaceae bacterium]|tara:strand:+ start:883 stop:1140 length:258 start_codon:yes stop_codon:yes gene_type:complete
MSDLANAFEQASQDAQQLASRPDNQTLLRMYALYKQGSIGDVTGDKPSMTDMVGFAKWSAWNKVKGMTNAEAQQAYVDLVEDLKD